MSTYTYPGVYIQELSSGVHTIAGVPTSIAAFVGWAPRGPVTNAALVESWTDYEGTFGGLDSRSYLGYAVYQFFLNGGRQAYIVRLVWDGTLPAVSGTPPASATAVAAGVGTASVQFKASLGSIVSPSATLFVGPAVLQSMQVTPLNLPPIPMNLPIQFTATGINTDTSQVALTASAKWTSSDPTVITMAAGGLGTPAGPGSAVITATDPTGVISGSMTVVVSAASLTKVSISPSSLALAVGQSVQLAATGLYSDNTSQDLTLLVQPWAVAGGSAVVSAGGLLNGVSASNANVVTVTAKVGAFSGSAPVTVSDKAVTSIAINPLTPVLQTTVFTTTNFAATAQYSDGTSGAPSGVSWQSSNPAVATIDGSGKATAVAAGSTTITATISSSPNFNQISTSQVVTPADAVTNTMKIESAGGTVYYTTQADAKVSDLINDINGAAVGLLAAIAPNGTLTITDTQNRSTSAAQQLKADVTSGFEINAVTPVFTNTPSTLASPFVASTTLAVTAAGLNSVAVTPASSSIATGQTLQLKAVGVYSDGTNADLTGCAAWSTGNGAVATVVAGLVLGQGAGAPATITAMWGNNVSGTAQVTVTPPVLVSIAIQPTSATSVGLQTTNFKAMGTYSDKSPKDISGSATWTLLSGSATVAGGAVTPGAAGGPLTLLAANPGAWGNSIQVSISASPNAGKFNLLVQLSSSSGPTQTVESYTNLSISTTDPQYFRTVIDSDSNFIEVGGADPAATPAPTAAPILLSGGADGAVLQPTDGNFEVVLNNDPNGVYLLSQVDIFNLLCIPGETDAVTIGTMQAYCALKRAFYIVDPPQTATYKSLLASGPAGTPANSGSITGVNSKNSAYYFPWVNAPDPLFKNRPRLFPPCGFVAGIYASTDGDPGVWKAPAGINASITGDTGLQFILTDLQNGDLNVQGINCLRHFKTFGDVVWGARTLQGSDQAGSEWKYVPIRRLALFIESSLYDGTQWAVFEPNDDTLWRELRLNVGSFLQDLFLKGAFAGTTPQQAYFVKCDSENNPPASVALGVVNILVGFAPLYPAEFVVIQIVQIAGQSS